MSISTTSKIVIVTPEMAKRWLEYNAYKHQRNLSKVKIKDYTASMLRGVWEDDTTIRFAVGSSGIDTVLIDGQHRLNAQIQANATIQYNVTYSPYRNEEHLARMYGTIDRGGPRTTFWALKTMGTQDLLGLADWQMNSSIASVRFIANKFIQAGTLLKGGSADDLLVDELIRYSDGIDKYFTLATANKQTKAIVRRSPVCALGIITLQYADKAYGEEKVESFWDGVLFGNNVSKGDPRKLAHDHLMFTELSSKKPPKNARTNPERIEKGNTSAEHQFRYLVACWNAYTEDRNLIMGRVGDPLGAVKINGTPWK